VTPFSFYKVLICINNIKGDGPSVIGFITEGNCTLTLDDATPFLCQMFPFFMLTMSLDSIVLVYK
jgi:hypothetical protein